MPKLTPNLTHKLAHKQTHKLTHELAHKLMHRASAARYVMQGKRKEITFNYLKIIGVMLQIAV